MSSDWQKNVKRIKCKKVTFNIDHKTKLQQKQVNTDSVTVKLDIFQVSTRNRHFINATLDLHHYSINDAYNKLMNFIIQNYQSYNRCLLVITGHGNTTTEVETIKSSLHRWLNSTKIQHMILSYKQAAKKHGGKGAFYILLKQNKRQT
jgi:DNA-nicking Smr family endonuclease